MSCVLEVMCARDYVCKRSCVLDVMCARGRNDVCDRSNICERSYVCVRSDVWNLCVQHIVGKLEDKTAIFIFLSHSKIPSIWDWCEQFNIFYLNIYGIGYFFLLKDMKDYFVYEYCGYLRPLSSGVTGVQ